MADNELTGAASPAQPVTAMTAPVEQQSPPAQAPQQPVPSGGGKSVDQLAKELDEQNALIRDAQDQLARMAHERELERVYYANLTAGKQAPQEPEAPAVTDDEFLANPAKATAKMLDGYMAREKAEREREKATQYVDSARRAFESGREAALKENRELFRGIETVVATEMLNNIRDSFKSGQPVDITVLENPRYHLAAALAMRVMNGDDLSKYFGPRQTVPMAPVYTETPSAGIPPKAAPVLSDSERALARSFGVTEEQWAETKSRREGAR